MFASIRMKLFIYTTAIVFFIASFMAVVFIVFAHNQNQNSLEQESLLEMGNIARASFNEVYRKDIRHLRNTLASFVENPTISFVYLLDVDGRVLSDGTVDNLRRGEPLEEFKSFASRLKSGRKPVSARTDNQILVGGEVSVAGSDPIGYVYLGVSLDSLNRKLTEDLYWMTFILLLCVILGGTASLFFSKRFVRPIISLTEAADHISQGNGDVGIPIDGDHEIATLGRAFTRMVSNLKEANQSIVVARIEAETDSLTGISNRRHIESEMRMEISRYNRYRRPLSLILMDLDYFKQVNDNFGHAAGDRVLKQCAEILTSHSRLTDQVGRWGGEEFVILAPETTIEGAAKQAESFRLILEGTEFDTVGKVTASFGVSEFREGDSSEDFFNRTDEALYQAKNEGRNRVCLGITAV